MFNDNGDDDYQTAGATLTWQAVKAQDGMLGQLVSGGICVMLTRASTQH